MNQVQPQADETRAEKGLRAACHDIAKMEAGIFGMPIDPDRAAKLYQYYNERGNQDDEA